MLEVRNLSKKYDSDNFAVEDLNFSVSSGHIYGFLGANGAGKTTTMNMIAGTLAPTFGEIYVCGHNIITDPIEAKKHIGYLPENPPLYNELTIEEYLSFVAKAKRFSNIEAKDQINNAMQATNIYDKKNALISTLSKGYRQRVGIAQAMIGKPEIIILDEPTVGLDPRQVVEIRSLISRLSHNSTVILSSHILSEVAEICDKLMIISNGHLVANDDMEKLRQNYAIGNILVITTLSTSAKMKEILTGVYSSKDFIGFEQHGAECTAKIKFDKKNDLRENVFFRFANAQCPILSMSVIEPSLEDVFLSLTEIKSEKNIKNEKKPNEINKYDNNFQNKGNRSEILKSQKNSVESSNDDDIDGDDYRPLFVKRR